MEDSRDLNIRIPCIKITDYPEIAKEVLIKATRTFRNIMLNNV